MATGVGVLVYGGYQELEFWYPVLRLREAEVPFPCWACKAIKPPTACWAIPSFRMPRCQGLAVRLFAAIVIPGGNVGNISGDQSLKTFLSEASATGAVIAAISQASALLPQGGKTIVAKTSDELPQWTKQLLTQLKS